MPDANSCDAAKAIKITDNGEAFSCRSGYPITAYGQCNPETSRIAEGLLANKYLLSP